MNSLFRDEPLLKRLREISHALSITEGGSHGPDHSERVLTTAVDIARQMNARRDILIPAALLHDIGRKEESQSRGQICHALRGAELASSLLRELAYNEPDIEAICHCIRSHRYRGGQVPVSLEARILFDADKLDSIGAVGIGRAFLFAGQIGARLHNPDADCTATLPYSLEDTAYREFQVKMSKVRDQMLTSVGRTLAVERHAFMLSFFAQLTRETQCSLSPLT
ncbi:MAG: HD domain-containing protein [Desulfobulbus sp.]|nr:HD domain-containing protein [Desulfobulbus sp.]